VAGSLLAMGTGCPNVTAGGDAARQTIPSAALAPAVKASATPRLPNHAAFMASPSVASSAAR
jgi:hypothetical protein